MSYQLTLEPLGATIEVQEGQTILDAALRQGIYIPHACGHGLCGTCKVLVQDGEVDHGAANPFALMDFERDEGKTLACCATLASDTTIEADIDEDPDAEIIPVNDYLTTVSRIVDLTPTIKAIFLKLDQPMHIQAGQYVQVNIPGAAGSRAFSIANSPSQVKAGVEIELNVRILNGGAGTTWLHQSLKIGDKLSVSGPYGRFLVRKSANMPMLFMAGGSGLSSPRSMILDLFENGNTQAVTLIYGQRKPDELYYDEEFKALAARHPLFTYVPALSDSAGGTGIAKGFVHEVAKAHCKDDFSGRKAYLCGPPAMIDACISVLMQGRLYERDIYTEKFLSAADTEQVRSPLFKRV
ncbi:MAG: 2Fe-2S iron-sulfur cluster binding domain-containing protein [Limnohabitans sp.]|nr:2Fe-2S iron-sulfur cluster binding domain-containing protein [Limnohabitans sp.]